MEEVNKLNILASIEYNYCFLACVAAVFVVCYLIAIIVIGVPLNFMEVSLGQYFRSGSIGVWKISPIFTGGIEISVFYAYQ